MNVMFPAIANESNSLDKVKVLGRNSVRVMSYIMFPVMIGICAVVRPLIILLLTEKWAECSLYQTVMCGISMVTLVLQVFIGCAIYILISEIFKVKSYIFEKILKK